MAASVEDQIHKSLVDREEQRCITIEAEYKRRGETRGKKEKRRKIAKPWKRAGVSALCQDIEFLEMVTEFDYDLSIMSFQEYCAARGVLHVAGEPGSTRWNFVADFEKTKDEYMSDSLFQFAMEVNGKKQQYSEQDMEFGWQLMLLARATMQDCWEPYSQKAKAFSSG